MISEFDEVIANLGEAGASAKAAGTILTELGEGMQPRINTA